MVEFAFGPRGKALKTGTKTAEPVDFAAAEKIFDKLVREKMAKGYTPHDSGVAYTNTEHEQDASGLAPLDSHHRGRGGALLADPAVRDAGETRRREPPVDGDRRRPGPRREPAEASTSTSPARLGRRPGGVQGNAVRRGAHGRRPVDAFDLLEHEGEDLRSLPYQVRYSRLVALATRSKASAWFKVTPLQRSMEAKRAELAKLRNIHAEGVVFKKLAEPFDAGRSTAALKFKFVDSATCIVLKHNLQRSIVVGLLGAQGDAISLGNVTVPANEPVPPLDALVEVRYLYRYETVVSSNPSICGNAPTSHARPLTLMQIVRIKRKAPQGAHALSE